MSAPRTASADLTGVRMELATSSRAAVADSLRGGTSIPELSCYTRGLHTLLNLARQVSGSAVVARNRHDPRSCAPRHPHTAGVAADHGRAACAARRGLSG